jgi:hypothetical protein
MVVVSKKAGAKSEAKSEEPEDEDTEKHKIDITIQ